MPTKFPIVMDETLFCGKCGFFTTHHMLAYPDSIIRTCVNCGLRTVEPTRYTPKDADDSELEKLLKDISYDANYLANKIMTHQWGNLGKKDRSFLDQILRDLLNITKKANRDIE